MEYLEQEIKEFFDRNCTGEVKNNIVWDAFKAYVGGALISLGAREKKNKRKRSEGAAKEDMRKGKGYT